MDNSHIEDRLDAVQSLFDEKPGEVETGLDVDGAETLQLRKACRLLDAARHLKSENGYYTVVIESSFAATERTLQFYLIDNDFLDPQEYVDHREVYERSNKSGLYSEEFKENWWRYGGTTAHAPTTGKEWGVEKEPTKCWNSQKLSTSISSNSPGRATNVSAVLRDGYHQTSKAMETPPTPINKNLHR